MRRKIPGDVEVARALFDVQVAMKRSRGEEINDMKFGGEVEVVSSNDQFGKEITAPGNSSLHSFFYWSYFDHENVLEHRRCNV